MRTVAVELQNIMGLPQNKTQKSYPNKIDL